MRTKFEVVYDQSKREDSFQEAKNSYKDTLTKSLANFIAFLFVFFLVLLALSNC